MENVKVRKMHRGIVAIILTVALMLGMIAVPQVANAKTVNYTPKITYAKKYNSKYQSQVRWAKPPAAYKNWKVQYIFRNSSRMVLGSGTAYKASTQYFVRYDGGGRFVRIRFVNGKNATNWSKLTTIKIK